MRILAIVLLLSGIAHAADGVEFLLTDPFPQAFVGFGAQMNPYLYCAPNWPGEVNEQNVKQLEDEVIALHPQHVRIFMLAHWWEKNLDEEVARRDPRMLESFYRTLALRAAAVERQ